jgi:hypothetical protein
MYADELRRKIFVLHDTVWERRVGEPALNRWLDNFATDEEKLHALYLLCQMMYFGDREVRELLRAVYRDLYRYSFVADLRRTRGRIDPSEVNDLFAQHLSRTRFVCLGTPAESSGHLMLPFRQANELAAESFVTAGDILVKDEHLGCQSVPRHIASAVSRGRIRLPQRLNSPEVDRYVFIDDLCGSGTQATNYSRDILARAKRLRSDLRFSYYTLLATPDGLKNVRDNTLFDDVDAVFEIDNSYKCFHPDSRYFKTAQPPVTAESASSIANKYGETLWPEHPLGFKNGQLLLAFAYNTPDNTLPIIWADDHNTSTNAHWQPIFHRYPKVKAS